LESGEGYGIKIKSKTNMSLENTNVPEEKEDNEGKKTLTPVGGMYLDSYKI
jgi:hypothetical protein